VGADSYVLRQEKHNIYGGKLSLKTNRMAIGSLVLMISILFCMGICTYGSNVTKHDTGSESTIRINTKRLSTGAIANVMIWKDKICNLAVDYPSHVFINGGNSKLKRVALTFDDGPDSSITSSIIAVLEKKRVKGTFFFVGRAAAYYPQVVKRAYALGHQVACHTYTHAQLTKIDSKSVTQEIVKSDHLFKTLIGVEPLYIRPPFGDLDKASLSGIPSDQKAIIWSLDTMDWVSGTTADEISNFVLNNVRPNDIILMHSSKGKNATLKAVPKIIDGLEAKGYKLVTVSDLVGNPAYK